MDYIANGIKYLFSGVPAQPKVNAPVEVKPDYPFQQQPPALRVNQYQNPAAASGLSTIGYYNDFNDTVGNRPVRKPYSQYVFPASRVNLQGRTFNCVQPVWGEDCI